MDPTMVNGILTALALLVAFFAFRRWLKSKRIWYMLAAVAAVLAAPAFWLSWRHGGFLLICALLLFALAELFKKRQKTT